MNSDGTIDIKKIWKGIKNTATFIVALPIMAGVFLLGVGSMVLLGLIVYWAAELMGPLGIVVGILLDLFIIWIFDISFN